MKKILLAVALLFATPAFAVAYESSIASAQDSVSGTLITNGDTITANVSGVKWATVKISFSTVGTSVYQVSYSVDGTNYLISGAGSPYLKRIDSVAANATVTAFNAFTPGAGTTWEFPLAANVSNVRIACTSSGTFTSLTVQGGMPYVPGVPVIAVIYDVTSAVNTPLNTGTLDVSGWNALFASLNASGGVPSYTFNEVDDAGGTANLQITAAITTLASFVTWGLGAAVGNIAGGVAVPAALPRRAAFNSAAIAAQTSRVRIEVRR